MKQFRRGQDITKLTLRSIDGHVGTIRPLYFDDQNWVVRYLVVRTGRWLMGRHVLITPIVIGTIDDADASIRINLHKEQIEFDSDHRADLPRPVNLSCSVNPRTGPVIRT